MKITFKSKIFTSMLLICINTSCKNEIIENKSYSVITNGQVTTETRTKPQRSNHQKKCKSSQVIEVLENANTVISKLKSDQDKIIAWNIDTETISHTFEFPLHYDLISSDGKFILRKINDKKFSVIDLVSKQEIKAQIHNYNSAKVPSFKFSKDSKYLLVSYFPLESENKYQILLFDLEQKKYIKSFKIENLKFVSMTNDSKYFLALIEKQSKQSLVKIDFEDLETKYEVELENKDQVIKFEVANEIVMLKTKKEFIFLELETGEKKYTKNYQYFYRIGNKQEYAMFSDNLKEFKILELFSGEEKFIIENPELKNLTDCKLDEEKLDLVCRDYVNQSKVVTWNLETNSLENFCY